MTETYYSKLVTEAINRRDTQAHQRLRKSLLESVNDSINQFEGVAEDIQLVNNYIKVDESVLDQATSDYEKIAKKLVEKLGWPNNSIKITPQGSASTRTLIRSPDNSKFDIDAVCSVNLPHIELDDPVRFYEKVGDALEEWNPEPKKRCWKIDFPGRHYYIEFTPSTPLKKISQSRADHIIFSPGSRYSEKALAVVDTPTQQWKTSNPEGFSDWVTYQSSRPVLKFILEKSMQDNYNAENVAPVPDQDVGISDTLRVAIRLLKRHRDMSVRRGYVDSELKPISIIIVTLLTQCYEGLADKGEIYNHPIDLLIDLVELMPYIVEQRENKYWIANPTVEGENFAEKWNEKPKLKNSFDTWINLLLIDLKKIMSAINQDSRRTLITEVFGCTAAQKPIPPNGSGLTPRKPTQTHKVPPTKGLA